MALKWKSIEDHKLLVGVWKGARQPAFSKGFGTLWREHNENLKDTSAWSCSWLRWKCFWSELTSSIFEIQIHDAMTHPKLWVTCDEKQLWASFLCCKRWEWLLIATPLLFLEVVLEESMNINSMRFYSVYRWQVQLIPLTIRMDVFIKAEVLIMKRTTDSHKPLALWRTVAWVRRNSVKWRVSEIYKDALKCAQRFMQPQISWKRVAAVSSLKS